MPIELEDGPVFIASSASLSPGIGQTIIERMSALGVVHFPLRPDPVAWRAMIEACGCFLVINDDGVASDTLVGSAIVTALTFKKPILVATTDDAPVPAILASRRSMAIDVADGANLAALIDALSATDTVDRKIETLEEYLHDALAAKASLGPRGTLANVGIATLRRKIQSLRDRDTEREDEEAPIDGPTPANESRYFVTRLPLVGNMPFSGRQAELYQVQDFLNQDINRILTIVGDSGMGKSTLVVQALKERASRGAVARNEYVVTEALSTNNPLGFASLFDDVLKVRPALQTFRNLSSDRKIQALLDSYSGAEAGTLIIFLDEIDNIMSKGQLTSPTLVGFLRRLLVAPFCSIKVISTSYVFPKDLAELPRCDRIRLKHGLSATETRRLIEALNERNPEGVGIETEAARFHEITGGNPQALLTLYAMRSSDPQVMEKMAAPKKRGEVLSRLLPEALPRLESDDEWVLQVLSVAGKPIRYDGILRILNKLKTNLLVREALDTLGDMGLVLEDEGEYHVHKSIEVFIVAKLEGERSMFPLLQSRLRKIRSHAADYFRSMASSTVVSERDVGDRLAEFNLRVQLGEFERADEILGEIEPFIERRSHHGLMRNLALVVVDAAPAGSAAKRSAARRLAWAYWRMWLPRKAFEVQKLLASSAKPEAEDLFRLAKYSRSLGDYGAAKNRLIEATAKAREEHADKLFLARIDAELGICHERTGFLGKALSHYSTAFEGAMSVLEASPGEAELRKTVGEYLRLRAACYLTIGWAERAASDIDDANDLMSPPEESADSLGQKVLHASLVASRGAFDRARSSMREVIEKRRQLSNSSGLEADLTRLGRWTLIDGSPNEALVLGNEAADLMMDRNGVDLSADILRGQSLAALERWEEARQLIAPLLTKRKEDGRMKRHCLLGISCLATGRVEQAADAFEGARDECQKWLRFPNEGSPIDRSIPNPEVLRLLVVALRGLDACGKGAEGQGDALLKLEKASETAGSKAWNAWWFDLLENASKAAGTASVPWTPRAAARSLTDADLSKIQEIVDKPAQEGRWGRVITAAREGLAAEGTLGRGLIGARSKTVVRTALSALVKGSKSEAARSMLRKVVLPYLGALDAEDQTLLANILVSYDLVDNLTKAELIERYDVLGTLRVDSADPGTRVGPYFAVDDDEVRTYQLFEQAFPPLDVASLWEGLIRSTAVCRIDIGARALGTGFLVASNRVLTNFHVLGHDLDGVKRAASDLTANFTSINPAMPLKKRTFKPTGDPIIASSPANVLDYVLIEMSEDIDAQIDARPIELSRQAVAMNDALHILQHPGGESLKLAISDNGVRKIDTTRGLMRYSTHARGGASGAPCFDEQWRLVALHHAEVSTSFGAVREGIIIGSIIDDIKAQNGG